MARTSRKTNVLENAPTPSLVAVVFKTAIYSRLSEEDKQNIAGNGGSLDNQILMCKKYIEDIPFLKLSGEFSDNGLTGTNFNRPGFESLMENIRQGKINCIVVKDLSRFGRDYIEAGNFLEVIFPRLGVRFISIGDNYDSFDPRCQGEGMCLALKNMINAFYAKDISVKTRTAKEAQQRKGEFFACSPPYGYLKSTTVKNKLIVDVESAAVVKDIFGLKKEGASYAQIAKHLNEKGILTPRYYQYVKGIFSDERYNSPTFWSGGTIRQILTNEMYLGHTILGKSRVNPNKTYDYIRQPKENWIFTPDTHEAIISQSDFDIVAEMVLQTKNENKANKGKTTRPPVPENIFKGFIYCTDCGHAIKRYSTLLKSNLYSISYCCGYCKKNKPDKATRKHISHVDFENAVYAAILQQMDVCADTRIIIEKIIASQPVIRQKTDLEIELRKIQQRIDRFPTMCMKLYDDYCDLVLSETDYKLFKSRYEAEKTELEVRLSQLLAEQAKLQPQLVDENKWVMEFERFKSENILTPKMLAALVERIDVDGNSVVDVKFRYRDEYAALREFIEEHDTEKREGVAI